MHRRGYLAGLLGSAAAGLAGCVGGPFPGTGGSSDPDQAVSSPVTGADGSPSGICSFDARRERIPAIVDPAFAADYSDVSTIDRLPDSTPVIGIERDGEARAYPAAITNEIVNDAFDVPVLVTYCPLCSSGLTAIRRVEGEETIFGNTSHTWTPPDAPGEDAIEEGRVFGIFHREDPAETTPRNDPNLVLFDERTGSYWSQLLAGAICGPRTGERLELIPSTATDWRSWKERHPDTSVLLPPPHSITMVG